MLAEKRKILLVGGGTMGSVSPLLAIASQYPADYLFVGSKSGPEGIAVKQAGLAFQTLSTGKWRRYWSIKNLIDIFKIIGALVVSLKILLKFKPEIILTAGSFVAVPIVWAAWILRIPRVIHQQDVQIGLANKLMVPVASKITVTFPEQEKLFSLSLRLRGRSDSRRGRFASGGEKVVITGNPVRTIKAVEDQPIVLITGGGLGARGFNKFVAEFIPQLIEHYPVHHILGQKNFDQALQLPNYQAHQFLVEGIDKLLARAEIIISRAGMSLITEAASLKKALIIIPIPDSHQELNAAWFAKHNAIFYVKQGSNRILARYLDKLLVNQELRQRLGENLHKLFPRRAVEKYIKVIDEVLKE